jgi:hypothetical protein
LRLWTVVAGLLALYGLLQRSGGFGPVLVPQMDRVMGTFGNPIFFAAYLVVSLFAAWSVFASADAGGWRRAAAISIVIQAAARFLTATRAAWIALAAAATLGYALTAARRRWGMVLCVAGGAGALFLYFTRHVWFRDQGHLLIWRDTLRMWAHQPWTGVGLGAFHVQFRSFAGPDLVAKWPEGQFIVNYAHNEYLQLLAEGGVGALVLFLAVVGAFVHQVFSMKKAGLLSPRLSPAAGMALGAAALLIQAFFSADLRFGVSTFFLFALLGLLDDPALVSEQPVPHRRSGPAPVFAVAGAGWAGLLALGAWPLVARPYRAQRTVSAEKDFFDQRLLDPAKSAQDLEALSARYPDEPRVVEKLAFVYAKEMKGPDGRLRPDMIQKAIAAYERLLVLEPSNAGAYNNMANIRYTAGQVPEALALWEKAVAVNPNFLDVHLNLGKIYYTRGDLKRAAEHFQIVQRLDPNNAEAIVYLKRMVE